MSGVVGGTGSRSGVIGETEIDYEVGVWTPKFNDTDKGLSGSYTKIGNTVHCNIWIWTNTTGDVANCKITNLPFSSEKWQDFLFNRVRGGQAEYIWGIADAGGSQIGLMTEGTSRWSNYQASQANWTYPASDGSIIAWAFSYVTSE